MTAAVVLGPEPTCDVCGFPLFDGRRPTCPTCNPAVEHRRDPSWRCTVLDPFTSREYRDGIGTYRRCPACAEQENRLMPHLAQMRPIPKDAP